MVVHRKDPENKKSGLSQLAEKRVGNAAWLSSRKARIGVIVVFATNKYCGINTINTICETYINGVGICVFIGDNNSA